MSKKKIYLFCDAGMSTSIMVNKMMETVQKHNMPLEISAHPVARIKDVIEAQKPIAVLLGPQVRFLFNKVQAELEPKKIPVMVIDSSSYGMMDGESVLKDTLKLIKKTTIGVN